MSIGYLVPKLGIICLKFFQGLSFGSLRKNLTLSIIASLLIYHKSVCLAQILSVRQYDSGTDPVA